MLAWPEAGSGFFTKKKPYKSELSQLSLAGLCLACGQGTGLVQLGLMAALSTVELKIEVVLPEKERGKEELSASGKGSPRAYQGNGTARHFHAEERLPTAQPYPSPQDCVEATVCHVKDLENGQWVLGCEGGGGA